MKSFIEHSLVIFSILASGSLIYVSYNDDLFLIIYFLICLIAFALRKKHRLSKYYFHYTLICIVYLLLHPFLLNNYSIINKNFGYLIRIVSFLLVISILGYQKFSLLYVKTMLLFCCLNLILYLDQILLFSISDPLASLFPLLTTWDGNVFYENYIFFVYPIKGTEGFFNLTIRNPGIFGEGGLYQYFLNLALIMNLYVHKRPVFSFINGIFVISIITTFSTVGYIIMIIVLANIVIGESSERHKHRALNFLIISPFVLYFLFSPVVVDKLFNKESTAFFSTQRRVLDTVIDYNVIKDNPILGIGLGNLETWRSYSFRFGGGAASSNGILNYLSKIGVIGFLITLYPFMKFDLKQKKNKMILLCNIFSTLSQGLVLTPVFLLSMSLLNQKDRIRSNSV